MKPHVASSPALDLPDDGLRTAVRWYRFVADRFLLLPLGALCAIVWANVWSESYYRFAHTLAFGVNEVAMALFLGLLAQDVVDALVPGGALYSWRRWSLPLVAATGGVLGAALTYRAYVSFAHETVLLPAWPVACAVDLAAAYYVVKTIVRRGAAIPFVVLTAAATDAFGLLVTGTRAAVLRPVPLLLAALALGLAAILRRRRTRAFWPYLAVCGPLSWLAFYTGGLHPALALVPLVPFLPHAARRVQVFEERPAVDAVRRSERWWHEAVQPVLFFFGLVNAGVLMQGYDTGTWAILVAGIAGRPLGVILATGLAVAAGLRLPAEMRWREVLVVAFATTSGFTFALLFATGLLPIGAVLAQVKLGALLTTVGALVAFVLARLLRVPGPAGSPAGVR